MNLLMQVEMWILFILFFLAAFLSIAETSLIGMSRIRIVANIKNNHPKAKYLNVWMKEPNKILATLSILINAVAISASTIGAFLSIQISKLYKLPEPFIATIVAILITIIIIIFGEISPKIFAIRNTEKMGLLLIQPVVYIFYVIKPITEIFVKISNLTVKLFGGTPTASIPVITAKDITSVLDAGFEEGYINAQEKAMMSSILRFKDLTVKDVMVPRTSIVAIDITWEPDKIIDFIVEEGYTRMPVYKNNLDNIVGIINTKDMLSMIKNRGLIIFQDLLRIPFFIPETTKLTDILKEFKKGKLHMAIVVDEFGGTSGIVTLEDILEEIVGEIKDEYDIEEKEIEKIDDKNFIAKANVEIIKLRNDYKLDIPEDNEVITLGGFLLALFNRVPKEGEQIRFDKLLFTVLKADAKRIHKIKITIEK